MPRAPQHFVIGVATGAFVNALVQWSEADGNPDHRFDWGELCLCSLAGGMGALLPDILEPATFPGHRQFFHSLAGAALVSFALSGRHTHGCSRCTRVLLLVTTTGYLSHIVADASTPKSIPWI